MHSIADLMARHARTGQIDWIGLRPARRAPMVPVSAAAVTEAGLEGDRARAGKRALTLIQAEHLPVIATLIDRPVQPDLLRRNLVISGLNLYALRGQHIQLGAAEIKTTGPCAPCSRMEEALGKGGYTAMRGHSGWCARIITPGAVALGDPVLAQTLQDGQ
ncbi:MAG: MOSC domain-containing protein [Pseudomonadota bacterium]